MHAGYQNLTVQHFLGGTNVRHHVGEEGVLINGDVSLHADSEAEVALCTLATTI